MTDVSPSAGNDIASDALNDTKPFAAFEWMIAMRYLRARKKETFVSVIAGFSLIGIMLGVAALIIVMAVMNGFREELLDRILGLNGHMIVHPVAYDLTDYSQVAERIEGVNGIKYALPLIEGKVLASNGSGGTGVVVRGLRNKDIQKIEAVATNIKAGTLENFGTDPDAPGVAIGIGLATQLGIVVGDNITIISPEGDVTPFGVNPRIKSYPVEAVFKIGMSQYDSVFVFMPLLESQLFFNAEDKVNMIEVFTEDPDNVDDFKTKVETAAERQVYVTDWRQNSTGLVSALDVERNVMFMILTLIVIVAALNIVSGLIMLVKDKGRDIAILRTMGATRGTILRVFLLTGSAIGIAGTIAGIIVGLLVTWNIKAIQTFFSWITGSNVWDPTVRFLTDIPAKMDVGETIAVIVMALALSFLATLFPAWRAAKLDPVEALRYE